MIQNKKDNAMKKNDKNLSIKDAFLELEEITGIFEKGTMDLEASIPLYKRATELASYLKSRLKQVEQQIEEIQIDKD